MVRAGVGAGHHAPLCAIPVHGERAIYVVARVYVIARGPHVVGGQGSQAYEVAEGWGGAWDEVPLRAVPVGDAAPGRRPYIVGGRPVHGYSPQWVQGEGRGQLPGVAVP